MEEVERRPMFRAYPQDRNGLKEKVRLKTSDTLENKRVSQRA